MRFGVVGAEHPCPGDVVLHRPSDAATNFAASRWIIPAAAANGKSVYCRIPTFMPIEDVQALLDFSAPYCRWYELGNEAPEAAWGQLFDWAESIVGLVHRAGGRASLAAARTRLTDDYLHAANQNGITERVGSVSIHPYAPTPDAALDILAEARERVPDNTMLHVSEFGIGLSPGRSTGYGATLVADSRAHQATICEEFFMGLLGKADAWDVKVALHFNCQDAMNGLWWGECGQYDHDGNPKPELIGAMQRVANAAVAR